MLSGVGMTLKSSTQVNNTKSDFFADSVRMHQGKYLSPIMFSYVNECEEFLAMDGDSGLNFITIMCNRFHKIMVLLYADYIVTN